MFAVVSVHDGFIAFHGEDGRTGTEPFNGETPEVALTRVTALLRTLGFDDFEFHPPS
jgi:hypothetical protein